MARKFGTHAARRVTAPGLHETLCERHVGRLPVCKGGRHCMWTIYLLEGEG